MGNLISAVRPEEALVPLACAFGTTFACGMACAPTGAGGSAAAKLEPEAAATLRAELESLSKKRARLVGIPQHSIDDLDDADGVKAAAIELVFAAMPSLPEQIAEPARRNRRMPQDEPAVDLEPAPGPEIAPHPRNSSVTRGYTTCLDRPYVQKEIQWALQQKKKIITLYEADLLRPGYFDYGEAAKKYKGTEWEFLLALDAIKYERGQFTEDAMLENIMAKASRDDVEPADPWLNEPGWWEFFLSHHQAYGSDQMKTLSLLFQTQSISTWYDNGKLDKSEAAMEEGVKHSQNFVLLLTADASTATCQMTLAADIETIPVGSPAREDFCNEFVEALAKLTLEQLKRRLSSQTAGSALDLWLNENRFEQFSEELKVQGVDSLLVLCDADAEDIDGLATEVGMPKLKAKSFSRNCAALREQMRQLKKRIEIEQLRAGSVTMVFRIHPPRDNLTEQPSVESIVQCVREIVSRGTADHDLDHEGRHRHLSPLLNFGGFESPDHLTQLIVAESGLTATFTGLTATSLADPDNSGVPSGESRAATRAERADPKPARRDPSEQPRGPYRTCLDRPYVQKEIRWALQYGKTIISVFEENKRYDYAFDYGKARERYRGTEWEFVLDIGGIEFQRDGYHEDGMRQNIFDMAKGSPPAAHADRRGTLNAEGCWDFFLSHQQQFANLQCGKLKTLFADKDKTSWLDMSMADRSEAAMEEGMRCSTYFVLFLTSDPDEMKKAKLSDQGTDEDLEMPSELADSNDDAALVVATSAKSAPDRESNFSDRPKLQHKIFEWAEKDGAAATPAGGCLVIGHAGTGKTTLLTELTEDDDSEFHSFVLAKHFCEYTSANSPSLKPSTFVRNFTSQVYNAAELYRQQVDSNIRLYPNVHRLMQGTTTSNFDAQRARVLLKRADPHANEDVVLERLKDVLAESQKKGGDPLEDFKEFVLEPLKAAYGSERPKDIGHVLVVDSLDEALLAQQTSTITATKGIVQLLQTCHTKGLFPGWLKILASSRDVPKVSNLRSWLRIELSDSDETRGSIRQYINTRLADADSEELHKYYAGTLSGGFNCKSEHSQRFKDLLQKCQGTFLYAKTFLNDLATNPSSSLEDIDKLPPGMSDLYCHYFEREFGDPDSQSPRHVGSGHTHYAHVKPAFAAIAASDYGVSEDLLLECLRLADPDAPQRLDAPQIFKDRLRSVRQFLKEDDPPELGSFVLRCEMCTTLKKVTTMQECASDRNFCDLCYTPGTAYRCSGSCDWDLCMECAAPPPEAPTNVPKRLNFYNLAGSATVAEWFRGGRQRMGCGRLQRTSRFGHRSIRCSGR